MCRFLLTLAPNGGIPMVYNKLVRDLIPELIKEQGEVPHFRFLCDEEYTRCLEDKLDEEVGEYHRDRNIGELADILEVVFALAENLGCTRDALMESYQRKHDARGGFQNRVFLISKDDG